MNFGKILGSISPAYGLLSGKGLFGSKDLLGGLGGMGLGGILGLLLSHGGGGGEGGDTAPQDASAQMIGDAGMGGPSTSGMQQNPVYSQQPMPQQPHQFGQLGGQTYMGGRQPIGQNPLGQFLGGLFR